MTTTNRTTNLWTRLPIMLRAIVVGFIVASCCKCVAVTAPKVGVKLAVVFEGLFLTVFLWWAHGEGPPRATEAFRAKAFRRCRLTTRQWLWGLIAALFFCGHSSYIPIVLLFRLPTPIPLRRSGRVTIFPSFLLTPCVGSQ